MPEEKERKERRAKNNISLTLCFVGTEHEAAENLMSPNSIRRRVSVMLYIRSISQFPFSGGADKTAFRIYN